MKYSEDQLLQLVVKNAERIYSTTGDKPTNKQVRDAIGSGSLSTITGALSDWWIQKQTQHALANSIPIPTSAENIATNFKDQLWAIAISEAKGLFEHQKQELLKKIEHAEAEASCALAEIKKLEIENEQLLSHNVSLKAAVESLRQAK